MVLIKALTGSRLHGLYNEESDHDWKIVNVSPLRHIISPFRRIKGKDSVSPEEDTCIFEAVHFCKLFASCNPTILEILWSNRFEVLEPLGKELVEGRTKMLDALRVFEAHRGYAKQQKAKMSLEEPNEHRTAKAIVAYIRIMQQGRQLLKTGDFDPVVKEDRDLLLEIKYGFDAKKHVPIALAKIEELEALMRDAYESCTLKFTPDLPWLEELIERIYLEKGNELQSTRK